MDYQHCTACGHDQYFSRPFCAACGDGTVETREAAGTGIIAAATMLHRPPSKELADQVPYEIVLVDLDEGLRVMARGPGGCRVGQRARLEKGADHLYHAVTEVSA